jgi:hypothetical protein
MARNNLRTVLTNEGLAQAPLVVSSGISAGTINKVYGGRRTPAPATMGKLVNGLNRLVNANRYTVRDIFPDAGV